MLNQGCFSLSKNLPGFSRAVLSSPIICPSDEITLYEISKNIVQEILTNKNYNQDVRLYYNPSQWHISISHDYKTPFDYAQPNLLIPYYDALTHMLSFSINHQTYTAKANFISIDIELNYSLQKKDMVPSLSFEGCVAVRNCENASTGESLDISQLSPNNVLLDTHSIWPIISKTNEPVYPYKWFDGFIEQYVNKIFCKNQDNEDSMVFEYYMERH